MDISLFKYYASKHGDRIIDIANCLGKTPAAVSGNLHGKKGDFTRKEIAILKNRWGLSDKETVDIFFGQ